LRAVKFIERKMIQANPRTGSNRRSFFCGLAAGRCWAWIAGLLLGSLAWLGAAEAPRLKVSLNSAQSSVRVELQGQAGVAYSVESSSNLLAWLPVPSGPASNGTLVIERPLSSGFARQFFRGKEAGGGTGTGFPDLLAPQADTNSQVSFLASTNGGSGFLYGRNGLQITFTLPPMTVLEPGIITMTLLTNVGGLPFSQGLVGAVRLEPEGLALWGAGKLEITLATNVDQRRVASFAGQADGTDCYLAPDRVTADRVIIPVTHLGLWGSGLAAASELSALASVADLAGSSLNSKEGKLRQNAAAACNGQEIQIAENFDAQMDDLIQRLSQEKARDLTAARQAQLSGEGGDRFDVVAVLERAEGLACHVLENDILPRVSEATQNCALSKELLSHVLAIERQRQLLGLAENPRCPSALNQFPLCAMMKNCVQEIKECCEGGIKGRPQIAAIYEIVRQEQLLGLDCLSEAEIDEAVEACSPGQWSGTLSMTIRGERSESDPGSGRSEAERLSDHFTGQVTESLEFAGPGSTFVNLKVEGQRTYERTETVIQAGGIDCGGFLSHDFDNLALTGNAAFVVSFTITPGTNPTIIITPDPGTPTPGTNTEYHYDRNGFFVLGPNGKECQVNEFSRTDTDPISQPPFAGIFGKPATIDGNKVSGSASVERAQLEIDGTGTFTWEFERRNASE